MRVAAILVLAAATVTSESSTFSSDHVDAAIRQFQYSTSHQRSGQHLLNIAALRNLRDADLKPLFFHFAQHTDWFVQVHAVLGLAELSDEGTIDPWLVQQISPDARENLIQQALQDGLIQSEQIDALLKWPLLESSPRLMLLAERKQLGDVIDKAVLIELARTTDVGVAMFAALLSEDVGLIDEVTRQLRRASGNDRDRALQRILELIRQYKLEASSPWLQSVLEDAAISLSVNERYWVLFTLLDIDKENGLVLWEHAFPTEPNKLQQVEYLLVLLQANITPTEKMIKRLEIDLNDPLVGLIAKAGAINKPPLEVTSEDVQALVALIERGHRKSTEWAFKAAKNLHAEYAAPFYAALSRIPENASLRRKEAASRAFSELIEIDPEEAWTILHETEDDSNQQEYLLYAMLRTTNEFSTNETVREAAKLKRIGVNNADVMTLLLIARGNEPLPEIDQTYLGIIAAGGSKVSKTLETQAAWLYLKKMGLADKAVAAVSTQ